VHGYDGGDHQRKDEDAENHRCGGNEEDRDRHHREADVSL
jgi:hypothetical protein